MKYGELSERIIQAALTVHSTLGPGLLEHTYRVCLQHELRKNGLEALSEVVLPVRYDGLEIDVGYRVDLLVERTVIAELKAVQQIAPVHRAQLLSYLKLSNKPVGLLINFHVESLKEGIQRIVN